MPGMGRGYGANNPLIVSAFHVALIHQGLIVLAILAVVGLVATAMGTAAIRRGEVAQGRGAAHFNESIGRRILRYGFGGLWVLDGALQTQPAMPVALPTQVIAPSASGSPQWVHLLTNAGTTIWSNHPVDAAAATVWIQVGLGVFLLVAPSGRWSRVAGAASALWAVMVWIFGEAFGEIFAPGLSWLFGAPGAAVFYMVAGVLVALPNRFWEAPTIGRRTLQSMGAFFFGMGVLQAWPGRGFWQGHAVNGEPIGALTKMARTMSQVAQPRLFSSWLRAFASFDAAHGFAVNLTIVVALLGVGSALLTGRDRLAFIGLVAALVLCLADWVLVEDFGFLGGVGTDPNSMIPMVVVLVGGYGALVRVKAVAPVMLEESPTAIRTTGYLPRISAAIGAMAVVLIGAVPMAFASVNPNADPILTEAINGTPNLESAPAPDFRLIDEHSVARSLVSWAGKTVVLTFLDPVCTTDCPLIAQELRESDLDLGRGADKVVFVAIDANPIDRSYAFVDAFDAQERLDSLANWHFLTGTVPELNQIWSAYGVQVSVSPAGAMVSHSDVVFVITPHSTISSILDADPGSGTRPLTSSFVSLLNSEIARAEQS